MPDLGAGIQNYFQGLQQNRSQQAYMRQLQSQQALRDAIEVFKATRVPPSKPQYDEKRGGFVDASTGKFTPIAGLPPLPAGSGGKLNPDYARAMAENGISDVSQVTPMMLFKAHQSNTKEASDLIAGRTPPQIVEVPGFDPEGRAIQTPYRVGKRDGEATPVLAAPSGGESGPQPLVGRKTTGTEEKMIANIQGTIPQLKDLRDRMVALGPERWNRSLGQRGLDYYKAKHFDMLPSDPDMSAALSQVIQVNSQVKAALASAAGLRSINFIDQSAGHIPEGYGDYNSILTNIDMLLQPNGPYMTMLRATGVPGTIPPASGGIRPSSGSGQFIGYSPDGRKVYKRANGSMYVQ